jgi:D-glycero-alpha-D-manno-heptose-7-phosphate kinase
MVISRTPLRVSFAGGGSDIYSYYSKFGGLVISTSIDKYIYVTVNSKFDKGFRIAYSKNEQVSTLSEIEHPIVREALSFLNFNSDVEITTIADIPSTGTGLGSSSSFTVGLLHALHAFQGNYVTKQRLAHESCIIEIEKCREPIGKQDQYASSFGGFNSIEFKNDGSVIVEPIVCLPSTLKCVEDNLLLFYTGITRSASKLLDYQSTALSSERKVQEIMHRMVEFSTQLKSDLCRNYTDSFGEILHESWLLKRSISKEISNSKIDEWYNIALKNGAIGGKILGAGAGGFLLVYAPVEFHEKIKFSLRDLRLMPIKFDKQGSSIVFYN